MEKQIVLCSCFVVLEELMNAMFYKLLKESYIYLCYVLLSLCETALEDLGRSVNGNILGLLSVPVMPQTKMPPCP